LRAIPRRRRVRRFALGVGNQHSCWLDLPTPMRRQTKTGRQAHFGVCRPSERRFVYCMKNSCVSSRQFVPGSRATKSSIIRPPLAMTGPASCGSWAKSRSAQSRTTPSRGAPEGSCAARSLHPGHGRSSASPDRRDPCAGCWGLSALQDSLLRFRLRPEKPSSFFRHCVRRSTLFGPGGGVSMWSMVPSRAEPNSSTPTRIRRFRSRCAQACPE